MRPFVPLLEELLAAHAAALGADFQGYRGHCYRVLNFCAALAPDAETALDRLAVATAFHDLGIWTHKTFDYLEPSVQDATAYLRRNGRESWTDEVCLMIREHHRIRPGHTTSAPLVEPFRRADWVDVSAGLVSFGLPRALIREAYSRWPSRGFHRRLVQLSWERFREHPLSPLPMLKL